MPMKKVTVRRGTIWLELLFMAALASVITLLVVRATQPPAPPFAPIKIIDALQVVGGTPTTPTQIAPTDMLVFAPVQTCNSAGKDLVAHVSVSLIYLDAPPMQSVAIYAGIPVALAKGCTTSHPNFKLNDKLVPGMWRLVITITVESGGRTQILSVESLPFVVDGG